MANDTTLAFADFRRGTLDCRPAPMCDPRPVCPACGGLECLCRPRFFAGQLLSEEDLNRLDHYIVAKNRLHNRVLFGTGVACGLEVVCGTCDPEGNGTVVVRPGYALSPCGNDIVVCKNEAVDVCDLINRCRPRAGDECYQPPAVAEVPDQGDEEWVLAICYQEKPSRGITALRGSSCSCGGACGSSHGGCGCGSGHGGCGCGGGKSASAGATYMAEASCGCGGATTTKTAKARAAAKPGLAPPQCEPTLTCEGYTFAVYKAPKKRERPDPGALIRRFECCLQPLSEQLQTLPSANASDKDRQAWLSDLIAAMRDFLASEGLYDCDVATKLGTIVVPPLGQGFQNQWDAATRSVLAIVVAVVQKCLCAALLPPCPPAEMNDCVPIATVTVARDRCRVRHVCNLENRKFLVTMPSIRYWLSWSPMFQSWSIPKPPGTGLLAGQPKSPTVRESLAGFCCTPVEDMLADTAKIRLEAAGALPVEEPEAGVHPFTMLMAESFSGVGPKVNAATVLLAAMGARAADNKSPLVSSSALAHPGEAILIDQLLAPAMSTLLPLLRGFKKLEDE